MAVNDTDEWASMIINEICEEAKMFSNTDNKEMKDKYKSVEISDRHTYSTRPKCENCKDHRFDFPHICNKGLKKNDLICNIKSNISDDFYKIENDATASINKYQDIFTNDQNVLPDYNLKSSSEMIKMTDVTDVEDASSETNINKKIKYDGVNISQIESEISKGKILTNFDEAFIVDSEVDSTKSEESVNKENIFSTENRSRISKTLSKMSHAKSDYSKYNSSECSDWKYDKKKNKFLLIDGDELSKMSLKKLYLRNRNTDFYEQDSEDDCNFNPFRGKADFQANNMSSGDSNLMPANEFSQDECFDRIDKKMKLIGFQNLQKEDNKRAKQTDSQSNLYLQWFEENYMVEEIESHLKPADDFGENLILAVNCSKTVPTKNFQNFSTGQNVNRNTENVDTKDEIRKKWDFRNKILFNEDIDGNQKKVNNSSMERKCKFISGENTESMNKNLAIQRMLSDINIEKSLEMNRYSDGFGKHHVCKTNKITLIKSNSLEYSFPVGQRSKRTHGEDEIEDGVEEMDDDELDVRNQRVNFIVARYREICLKFEIVFLRPFANLLSDCCGLITFIFFLIICIFIFLFVKIQFLISNYIMRNIIRSSYYPLYEEENAAINTDETTKATTASNRKTIDEDTFSEINEAATVKLSPEKSTDVKIRQNISPWVYVEPEEIEIVFINCEFESGKVISLFEKNEYFLSIFSNTEQHRSTIKTSADFLTVFEFIDNDENHENELRFSESDFDMEIIASSKSYGVKKIGDHVTEIQDKHKDGFELKPIIARNPHSFLTEILPEISCSNEKPLFNSTEVDGVEMELVSEHARCCHLDVLYALDIANAEEFLKMQVYSRKSPERRISNSSLNVNLPSFSSRSDIVSKSAPLLENSESFVDDNFMELINNIEILNKVKKEEHCESLLLGSLHASATQDSQNTSKLDIKSSLKKEGDETSIESVDKNASNYNVILNIEKENSGFSSVSDIADVRSQNSNTLGRSVMCGDANFMSDLSSSPSKQSERSMKDEIESNEIKDNPKMKSSLKHRMSSVLDNWKIRPVMSCLGMNSKNKKKHCENDCTKGK